MPNKYDKINILILLIIAVSVVSAAAQNEIVELEFLMPSLNGYDSSRPQYDILKVREAGGPCQNGLYLLTCTGDLNNLFEKENRAMIETPLLNRSWRYCSIFSAAGNDTAWMGRNWDNENVGSIIVSFYKPYKGYASVFFSRSIDLGFPLHVDLDEIVGSELGSNLLLAPFYTYDGMNEHGLAVGIAGCAPQTVKSIEGKPKIMIPYLVRKILDGARTIDEALVLVEDYIPFDLDENSLNSHLFVMDSSGRSLILEYIANQWRKTSADGPWQVMSTKPVYNVPDSVLRKNCWRYLGMSESLEQADGNINFKTALEILQNVSQIGTVWSAVYSPTTKDLYFSVYQHWDKIYHLPFPLKQ